MDTSALVFDLGGTHLRSAVSHRMELAAFEKRRIGSMVHGLTPKDVWRGIIELMLDYADRVKELLSPYSPIVLAFPGPIEQHGRIVNAPTLVGQSLEIPDICAELNRRTGRTVRIINDISAAAWYFSTIVGAKRFMVVTVSSGIGAKIYHPLEGPIDDVAFAGEIGHTIVDEGPDALVCDCGGKGHLGAIASGRGIERFAQRRAVTDPSTFERSACVRVFGATASTLSNEEHLVPAVLEGDAWATDVVRHCTRPLARVALSALFAAGLDSAIFIGGFALSLGSVYLQILREAVTASCDYAPLVPSVCGRFVLGEMTEEACLLGAAVCARAFHKAA